MAKRLSEDEIKYVISAETAKAQKEIYDLSKATKELKREERERRKAMIELEAQGKKNTDEYKRLSKECKEYSKSISENEKKTDELRKKLDINGMSMAQLRKQTKDLRREMDNMSKAMEPERYSELEKQLSKVSERMNDLKVSSKNLIELATSETALSTMAGMLSTKIAEFAGDTIAKMKDIALEGVEMAKSADGVKRAFDAIDDGTILNNLRTATKGTVTDLELMKATVKAKDFRIPLDDLGKYLQFAQLKAQQTGQSVEYMTDSIVTGLGRRSPLILDNLGLSAAEINEQVSKTGDFMSAVATIVDKQLAAAGENYVSASDRAQAASVRFKNAQLELGQTLLPLKENWDEIYTGLSVGTMELIGWVVKHRDVLATLVTAYTAYRIAVQLATTETYKNATATKASVLLDKIKLAWTNNIKGATLLYAAAKAILTGNTLKANEAMKLFNTTCKKNIIGFLVSAVITAISYFAIFRNETDGVTEAQRKMNDELERTKETLDRIAGVKLNAENIQFLTERQKEQMKSDAKQSIAELEDLITKGMISNKKWYESEKKSILKMTADNEVLKKSYLNGLEHDLKERMNVIAGYIDEKKKLEKIIEMVPDKGKLDLVEAKKKEIEVAEKEIATTKEEVEARNKKVEALKAELEALQNLGIQKKKNNPNGESDKKKAEKELLESEKRMIADMATLRDQALEDEERRNTAAMNAKRILLSEKRITQQQYEIWEVAYSSNLADRRLSIEEEYTRNVQALDIKTGDLKEQAVKDAGKRVEQAEQQSFNARLKTEQVFRSNMDTLREMAKKTPTTPEAKLKAEYNTQLQLLEAYYKASLKYAEEYGQDEAEVTELYNQAKLNLDEKYQEEKKKLAEKSSDELKALQGNDISQQFTDIFNNIQKLQEAIENADFGGMLQSIQAIVNSVLGGLSNAFNTFKQIEIDNVEAKYDAEIEAAQNNTEEVERLEKEKAQKKLDIEKKYADVQFAVKASQIIANTALAIMMALGQLGPIAGPIAAGLMAATGAVQLAAANTERQKVKSMTISGSEANGRGRRVATGRQEGGKIDVRRAQDGKLFPDADYDPNARGFIDRPTVIVGEGPSGQSKEWVASNAAVNNPTVAPILDLLDRSQQAGTIRTLDLNQAIRARMAGYSSGGSISTPASTIQPQPNDSGAVLPPELMKRFANAIIRLDEEGLPPAPVLLSDIERKQELRNRSRSIGSKRNL